MLSNIKISGKIGIVIALMAIAMLMIAIVGKVGISQMNTQCGLIESQGNAAVLGARMNQNLLAMNRAEYRTAANQQETEEAAKVLNDNAALFDERIANLEKLLNGAHADELRKVRDAYAQYHQGALGTVETARKHSDNPTDKVREEIMDHVHVSRARANALNTEVKTLVDAIDADAHQVFEQSKQQGESFTLLMLSVAGLGLLLGVAGPDAERGTPQNGNS